MYVATSIDAIDGFCTLRYYNIRKEALIMDNEGISQSRNLKSNRLYDPAETST